MSRSLGGIVVHDLAADLDLAAADLLKPRDHAQQRRLAAARGADQHRELAVGDRRCRRRGSRGCRRSIYERCGCGRRPSISPRPPLLRLRHCTGRDIHLGTAGRWLSRINSQCSVAELAAARGRYTDFTLRYSRHAFQRKRRKAKCCQS